MKGIECDRDLSGMAPLRLSSGDPKEVKEPSRDPEEQHPSVRKSTCKSPGARPRSLARSGTDKETGVAGIE